jgi:hypothetical protein
MFRVSYMCTAAFNRPSRTNAAECDTEVAHVVNSRQCGKSRRDWKFNLLYSESNPPEDAHLETASSEWMS